MLPFFSIMDQRGNNTIIAHETTQGVYFTLKKLKECKFGDTVRITEIKTPIAQYQVPKEVHDDPASWEAFSKIFISPNREMFKKNLELTFISYLRSDGKPEKDSLMKIHQVNSLAGYSYMVFNICHVCCANKGLKKKV